MYENNTTTLSAPQKVCVPKSEMCGADFVVAPVFSIVLLAYLMLIGIELFVKKMEQ